MRTYLSILIGLAISAGVAHAEGSAAEWAEKVKIGGDLRLREDYTGMDGAPNTYKERYRLRLNVTTDVNEDIKLKARIATASASGTVDEGGTLSNNTTFDN